MHICPLLVIIVVNLHKLQRLIEHVINVNFLYVNAWIETQSTEETNEHMRMQCDLIKNH